MHNIIYLILIQWLHYGLHHKVGQSYFDVRNNWKKQPKELIKMNESRPVLKKIHLAQTLSQCHATHGDMSWWGDGSSCSLSSCSMM